MKLGYRTIKTVLGVMITIYIANLLGLRFASSAGVITMLSILETKKRSLQIAGQRIIATTIGLLIAWIIYSLLGISVLVYGLILLLFIPIANRMAFNSAIVINAVLFSHFLSEQSVAIQMVWNEFALILLGVGMGLVINVHMPNLESHLIDRKADIEDQLKRILNHFSLNLRNQCGINEQKALDELEELIKSGKALAYRYLENHFLDDHSYYVEYMQMRERQLHSLKVMNHQLKHFFVTKEIPNQLSDYTHYVSIHVGLNDETSSFIDQLEKLLDEMRNRALPRTRDEFEERALLFNYILALEELLMIKYEFLKKYQNRE